MYNKEAVFMIEWPDRGGDYLPRADLTVHFEHCGEQRILKFIAHNEQSEALISGLDEYSQ